jgi:predicted Rossmann-fold nucleotide-binding protein
VEWVRGSPLRDGMISADDLGLLKVVDTADEAVAVINEFYSETLER